ncbi:hypothetical protein Tco_0155645 [Tanacetum coccineum]
MKVGWWDGSFGDASLRGSFGGDGDFDLVIGVGVGPLSRLAVLEPFGDLGLPPVEGPDSVNQAWEIFDQIPRRATGACSYTQANDVFYNFHQDEVFVPADYVSAGHVLVSADRDRIC